MQENYKLTKEQYIKAYKQMLLIRRFEEKCASIYGMGLIGGFCHLYIGQEAVAVGVDLAKTKEDLTITSYRDHAHIILSGMDPKFALAELMGKKHGCSKGKGGSMHMFNTEGNFYGGHGIVGAQVPIGTGIAFTQKYLKTNHISFTFLGDGAINQGQVYEAMNMAKLWGLPVIYIIENNEYSMGTAVNRSTAMMDLYKKGISFGIEGFQVDGMSLDDVYSKTKMAIDIVKKNNTPVILEMKTYRYKGHSMSDPASYRTRDEVNEYKTLDPIINVERYLTKDEIENINQSVKKIIADTVHFANNDDFPSEEELYTDVYSS